MRERRLESLLEGVLGEVEVTDDADEDRKAAPPFLAEDLFDYDSTPAPRMTTGRTSTTPLRADGIRAAHSIASSSDSASIR